MNTDAVMVTMFTLKTHLHGHLELPPIFRREGPSAARDGTFSVANTTGNNGELPQTLAYRYVLARVEISYVQRRRT